LNFTLSKVNCRHAYLADRGIEERSAIGYGVGYDGGCGMMSGRVVMPIHEEHGHKAPAGEERLGTSAETAA
jgi:hypothetical protein